MSLATFAKNRQCGCDNIFAAAMDDRSVLSVPSLLDSQVFVQAAESVNAACDEEDVFQCGRCKKQFTSIICFITHKKESCRPSSNGLAVSTLQPPVIQQNTVLVKKVQVPSSLPSSYGHNVVMTETELFPVSTDCRIDQNITTSAVSASGVQVPSLNIVTSADISSEHNEVSPFQQIYPKAQTVKEMEPVSSTISVPLLGNKLISGPLLLVSQSNNSSSISGVVLNIASPAVTMASTVDVGANNSQQLEVPEVHKVTEDVPTKLDDLPEQAQEEELSTVNVIAEFHTSMVKTKKRNTRNDTEEESKKDHKLNCAYCYKSFTKNFDLQQHIRCHTGEKPFQCIVCGRAFAQKSNVKKHMHTHKVWPDGLSNTLPKLGRNSSSSGEDGKVDCPGDHLPGDADNEKEDRMEKGVENSYACPYCTYVGETYYNLKSHMKQHETKKVYKCIISTCSLMFEELDPFLEHTKSHENEMTYRCHECNKNFSSLYELGSHQYTHSLYPNKHSKAAKRVFRCTLCLNKYSTPAALNHHIATSSHTYSCTHCDKVFPCERYLRRHLHIHADAESFVCKLCSKGFRTENYLKVHMLTHSSSKPFACDVCKAAFNRKDKLKRHLLIHEPVKQYKCPFSSHIGCGKEFSRPDKLKAHILTHTYLKPYVCRTCDQNFPRMSHLREHVKAHKPCSNVLDDCKWCGEKFDNEKDSLKHQCKHIIALQKKQNQNTRQKTLRDISSLSKRRRNIRRRSRAKRQVKHEEKSEHSVVEDAEILDGIPTAHIEIISTNAELVSSGNMSDLSLPSNFENDSTQGQFEEASSNCIPNSHADNSGTSNFCSVALHASENNYKQHSEIHGNS